MSKLATLTLSLGGSSSLEEDGDFEDVEEVKFTKSAKIEIGGTELSTESDPEVLIGALKYMQDRQRALEARGDSTAEQLAAKVADFKAIKQRLAEIEAGGPKVFDGPESGLKKYAHKLKGSDESALQLGVKKNKACKDLEYGLLDDPEPVCDWQASLQDLIEDWHICKVGTAMGETPVTSARVRRHLESAPEAMKKLAGWSNFLKIFSDDTGQGADAIIDLGLPVMSRDDRLMTDLEAAFPVKPMSAKTELLPVLTTHLRPFKHVSGSVDDPARLRASSIGTDQRQIDATGLTIRTQLDLDAEEDAIIPILSELRSMGPQSLAYGWEDGAINGDTTAAGHQDDIANWDDLGIWGTGAFSDDHRRVMMGFRRYALDNGNAADRSAAETYAGLLGDRANLKSPLGVGANLVHVVSVVSYILKFLSMTELATVDQRGPTATILTGEALRVANIRILISEFMSSRMNGSGLFDNATLDKSGRLTINTARWWKTERAGNTVAAQLDITRNVRNLVFRNRKGLFAQGPSAATVADTEKSVYYGYNLATS